MVELLLQKKIALDKIKAMQENAIQTDNFNKL